MKRIRVIPVLLLKGEGLVKTIKFKDPNYIGDPINAVKIFNEKEVDELILLDISATVEKRPPNFKKIVEVASECFMPLGYGGGITNIEQIKEIMNSGVEKVALNTSAVKNPELLDEAARLFGSQSIMVSIDVKRNIWGKYEVYIESGTVGTGKTPVDFAREVENRGAGEVILNSINKDGTFTGYDLALLRKVSDAIQIPLISCGGACNISDFADAVNKGSASAVAAGSMFVYIGKQRGILINYPEQKVLKEKLFEIL